MTEVVPLTRKRKNSKEEIPILDHPKKRWTKSTTVIEGTSIATQELVEKKEAIGQGEEVVGEEEHVATQEPTIENGVVEVVPPLQENIEEPDKF
jgi:hypothetical protein